MLHGKKKSEESKKMAASLFKDDSSGINLPSIKISEDNLKKNIIELVANISKEFSKSEIRRLIKSNAIKINNKLVNDEKLIVEKKFFLEKGFIKLSIGKKKHFKIII